MLRVIDKIEAASPTSKALSLSNFPVLHEVPAIALRAVNILVITRVSHSISFLVTDACASFAAHGEAH
jgi:hypothetical protein